MRLGHRFHPLLSKARNFWPVWQGVLAGLLVTALLVTSDRLSVYYGLTESQRVIDDLLGGALAGTILFVYERRRERLLVQKLMTIDLMNHHVRNALQLVMFISHGPNCDQQTKLIDESVNRIDFALREILPGKPGIGSDRTDWFKPAR
jgi:hypothetical protein